jgi:alpha/beta hydrolase family protein DUF900
MTIFVSLREQTTAGSVIDGQVYEGFANRSEMKWKDPTWLRLQVKGKDVLLATHGFNVNQQRGVNSLGRLGDRLAQSPSAQNEFFIGVLWPGDWWIPVVNYPAEASDAVESGRRLATVCNKHLTLARSLSFISHSLGARVILEAVKGLVPRARIACITAAAADYDCLDVQCEAARKNCDQIVNLASNKDTVLKYAYPAGDFLSDIFGDDDSPLNRALGLRGPKNPWSTNVEPHQIPDGAEYGHGNYLPPSDSVAPSGKWEKASDFMIRAFRRERQSWP